MTSAATDPDPIEELIALYALDALDADDRAWVESRLATDARARAQLDEFRRTIGHLHASAAAAQPPARVKERVMARINADLASRGVVTSRERTWDCLKRLLFPFSLAVAAASLILAIGLGAWAISLQGQLTQAQQELALLQSPSLRVVSLPRADTPVAAAGAQANLLLSPQSATAVLTVNGLPPLSADQTYQFWLLRGGQPIPAGTFNVSADGTGKLVVQAGEPLGAFDQAGITIEPAGGSTTPNLAALISIGSIQ